MFGPEVTIRFAVKLLQLAKFFRERHARQQGIDPLLNALLRRPRQLWRQG
jgi:hypothetical protein